MVFSSIPFLYYFLPLVVLLYYLVPGKLKNTSLLLSSLAFYAWGEQRLVILFAIAILLGWILGILIEKYRDTILSKAFLSLSIITDLGLLCYFKYYDFFARSFNKAFGLSIPILSIALPIGISFYIFQLISYCIDVYRNNVSANKNIINFATYVSFFPQLIAGPIVRYSDIEGQLKKRNHSIAMIASGIERFFIGLVKKVLIANVLGEFINHFNSSHNQTILFYWVAAICFSLQIYYDFSGYSDMAIGLGKIFGFELKENFNYPFISKSITEFWRRWHMSLGSWFRDYVYIPLGGNRKGIARQLLNILIVWMLTGLWHGAAWNFVLWGLFFAILLTIEKLGFKNRIEKIKGLNHLYVLLAVIVSFALFNADTLSDSIANIKGMFDFGSMKLSSAETAYYIRSYIITIFIAILGSTPLPKNIICRLMHNSKSRTIIYILEPVLIAAALIISTAYLVDGSFNPFLYFRF